MAYSKIYHLLLLGILPIVVLLIYFEGQHYDPALIRFDTSRAGKDNFTAFFPADVGKFRKVGQIRSYTKENLYEYVNGHAEYFISAGFNRLGVGEYRAASPDSAEPEVIVDVYDMGKSIQAFGILSDESGGRLSDLETGMPGFRTPLGISFVKGRYYVKISAYNENISLDSFTKSFAGKIGEESDTFPEFARLPDIGDIAATRFIKESYRGLDFLNNVLEREYMIDGEAVQVFIIPGSKQDIKKLIDLFLDYFAESNITYILTEKNDKKLFRINDRFEGDWVMISTPDALYGIYGAFNDILINSIITAKNIRTEKAETGDSNVI